MVNKDYKRRVVTDAELVEPLALCIDVHLSHIGVLQRRTDKHSDTMCGKGQPLPSKLYVGAILKWAENVEKIYYTQQQRGFNVGTNAYN